LLTTNSIAVEPANQLEYIDDWLNILDLKCNFEQSAFKFQDYSSTNIWTELSGLSTIVLNLKVYNRIKNPPVPANNADIPISVFKEYVNTWFYTVFAITTSHVNGSPWRPKFKNLIVKMNGVIECKYEINGNLSLKEIMK
jgi:hypothetical protein